MSFPKKRKGRSTQVGIARGNAVKGRPIAWFRDRLVDLLRAACDYATSCNSSIVLEPTNRFEHGTVHTIDEGIRIIERARDHVRYFHLHDSDRVAHHGDRGDKRRDGERAKPRPNGDLRTEGRRQPTAGKSLWEMNLAPQVKQRVFSVERQAKCD